MYYIFTKYEPEENNYSYAYIGKIASETASTNYRNKDEKMMEFKTIRECIENLELPVTVLELDVDFSEDELNEIINIYNEQPSVKDKISRERIIHSFENGYFYLK